MLADYSRHISIQGTTACLINVFVCVLLHGPNESVPQPYSLMPTVDDCAFVQQKNSCVKLSVCLCSLTLK